MAFTPNDGTKRPNRRRRLIIAGVVVSLLVAGALAFVLIRQERLRRHMVATRDASYASLAQGDFESALNQSGSYLNYAGRDEPRPLFTYARAREEVESANNRHLNEAVAFYQQYLSDFPGAERTQLAKQRLARLYASVGAWDELIELTDSLGDDVQADDDLQLEQLRLRASALAVNDRLDESLVTALAYLDKRPLDADVLTMVLSLEEAEDERGLDAASTRVANLRQEHGDDPRVLLVATAEALLRDERDEAKSLAAGVAEAVLDGASLAPQEGDDEGRVIRRLVQLLDATGQSAQATQVLVAGAGRVSDEADTNIAKLAANRLARAGESQALLDLTEEADPKTASELVGIRGIAFLETGQNDRAAALIETLKSRPEGSPAQAWANLLPMWQTLDQRHATLPLTIDQDRPPQARMAAAREALKIYTHPLFLVQLGEALLDVDEPTAARSMFVSGLSATRGTGGGPWLRATADLAEAARRSADTQTASAALASLRANFPDDPNAIAEVVLLLARAGNVDEARKLLDEAESPQLTLLRQALLPDAPPADAAAAAEVPIGRALDIATLARRANADGFDGLLRLVTNRDGISPTARAVAAALHGEAPDIDDSMPTDLRILLLGGADRAAAAKLLREATSSDASESGADFGIARLIWQGNLLDLNDEEDWTRARRVTVRAVEAVEPHGAVWPVRLARLDLSRPGDEAEAAVIREHAIDLGAVTRNYPADVEARLTLAAVLERLELDDEAMDQLVAAVEAAPGNVALRLEVARRKFVRGDDASGDLATLTRDPSRLSSSNKQALVSLLEASGDYEGALSVVPETASLDLGRLSLQARAGRLDEETLLKAAASDDAAIVAFAAEQLARAGRPDEAMQAVFKG